MSNQQFIPLTFNMYKPANISSYDVIRTIKRSFGKKLGKIGHFGTLDPFACGVLLVGVGGAARLNEYIHEMPKTYLAVGKLGEETETGDFTAPVSQKDTSPYLDQTIAKMDVEFIQKQLQDKFLGDYYQAPHKYSAAKHQGKKLLEWAREGVDIKKEKKLRHIYELEVVSYDFPLLTIRVKVSSGTYIRTLFSECANHLGTIGSLVSLEREAVGHHHIKESIQQNNWPNGQDWDYHGFGLRPEQTLLLPKVIFAPKESKLVANGVQLKLDRALECEDSESLLYWAYSADDKLLGLIKKIDGEWRVQVNFS